MRILQYFERKSYRLNKSKTKPEEKHENSSGLIFLNPLTEYKQSVTLKMRKAKIFFYQMSEIIYAGSAWIPNIHNYIANGK